MTAVRVIYTVQEGYVEHNEENIRRVMSELRALNRSDVRYATFIENDGKTFMHFAIRKDGNSFDLTTLESFKTFQRELKESQPEKPPVSTTLSLVDSSYDIF